MKKSPIDYEKYSAELKRKANFFANKIWGIDFNGNVEFCKGQKRLAEIVFWGKEPSIRFKRDLASSQLEFCVDDLMIKMLTRWYCYKSGLKKEKDYLENLKLHEICTTGSLFIYNKTAYTGTIEKRFWEPTIKLIDLVLEYEANK